MRRYLIALIIFLSFSLIIPAQVEAGDFFTMEMGTVLGFGITSSHDNNFNPLQVTQLGYGRRKDDIYLHIFWGSLEDDQFDEKYQDYQGQDYQGRNSYLFGEIGYQQDFSKEPYFWRASIGLGKVNKTSEYLSSHNMFTFSFSLGYERYYISWRHMSNGETIMENAAPNAGRDNLTLGIEF